jgi:uncharacterized protein
MTNEERDLILSFIQRVGGKPAASGGFAGSVPPVGTPNLPPVDPEADALLAELFARYPEARYRITQLAFVQEHALAEATNQISALQTALQQARAAQTQAPPPASSPWGQTQSAPPQPQRSFLGGLFGSGQPQPPPQYAPQPQYAPPPQPQYAPGYQPGMFQRSGSGFLGSALTTAAGVAGGMMAANALTGLFSGHHDGGFGSNASYMPDQGGFGGGQAAAPWATPAVDAPASDPYSQGGEQKDFADQNTWQPAPQQDDGWQDASAAPDTDSWTDVDNS